MKHALFITCFVLVPLHVGSLQAQDSKPAQTSPIELPDDPQTPALVFNFTGGYRIAPPQGFKPEPRLTIYPNGKVVCGRFEARMARREYQMPEGELNKLLDYVLNQQRAFEITSESIKSKIKRSGVHAMVADAPTSVFQFNTKQKSHEFSVYAVSFVASQFEGKIWELENVIAIQERLRRVYNRALLGTDEEAGEVLSVVNAALKKSAPTANPMTLGDMESGAVYQNGRRSFTFKSYLKDDQGRPRQSYFVNFNQTGDQKPDMTVRVSDLKRVSDRPGR